MSRLRVHPTQEWHDLYSSDCVEDLQRYFDYFLKGIENGWENTSQVRLSTVAFNQVDTSLQAVDAGSNIEIGA